MSLLQAMTRPPGIWTPAVHPAGVEWLDVALYGGVELGGRGDRWSLDWLPETVQC